MKKNLKSGLATMIALILVFRIFPMYALAAAPTSGTITPQGWSDSDYWYVYIQGVQKRVPKGNVIGLGSSDPAGVEGPVTIAQMALNNIDSSDSRANCNTGIVDGQFGTNTENGVRNFQTYINHYITYYDILVVDGWIGPNTWNCITGLSM